MNGTESQSGQTPQVTISHNSGLPSPSQAEYFRNDMLSANNSGSYEWYVTLVRINCCVAVSANQRCRDVPNAFDYASPQSALSKTVSDHPMTTLESGHLDDAPSDLLLNQQGWSNNVPDMFESFNWEPEPNHNAKKRKRSDIEERG